MKINSKNTDTFAKSGRDQIKVDTNLFILLIELILRRGLRTLNAFKAPNPDTPGMNSQRLKLIKGDLTLLSQQRSQ